MKRTHLPVLALFGGPVVVFVIGASTSSVRDEVGASNIGIALAIVVVLAALVSRGAGLATAGGAAITFNFFHTEPYHSLRVHSARDVTIVALLAGLGMVVTDISGWIRRRDLIAARHRIATDAPTQIEALLSTCRPVSEVWPSTVESIMDQLTLAECRFDRNEMTGLPLISRVVSKGDDGDDGFVLPSSGASVSVVADEITLGHLLVVPRRGISSLWVERRVVIALADHVAIALTYTGHNKINTSTTKESQ